jgi:opacity protein-like surface antigen
MIRMFVRAGALIAWCAALAAAAAAAPLAYTAYDGVPPDARAAAMGLAQTAVAGSMAAPYFNPASLAGLSTNGLAITYEAARQSSLDPDTVFAQEPLQDNRLMSLSLIAAKGALSWRPLSNSSAHVLTADGYEDTQVIIHGLTFSAANAVSGRFTTGLNLTYLNGRIARAAVANTVPEASIHDGNGCAMDLGFLYAAATAITVGLDVKNLCGFMWWDGYAREQLPLIARYGFAYTAAQQFTFAADVETTYYRTEPGTRTTTHFGAEQILWQSLSLRAGTYGTDLNDRTTAHVTAGIGYNEQKYRLSLAGDSYRIDGTDVMRYVVSLDIPLN